MEQVGKFKYLYKLELVLLKIIPMLLALCYFSNTILSLFGYKYTIFSIISGMSVLPMIFLYLSSYAFRFCEYHRIFLHYVVINECIVWYDYHYGIPYNDRTLLVIHIGIACVCLFLILYLKQQVCKKY